MPASRSCGGMVLDSLRYWVSEMHVDGFRFDLAAALTRGRAGRPSLDAPLIRDIETDPVLAGTKLIAEAWDAGGEYQVGTFAGERWCEWNGRFRDDVRSFVKSDPGVAGESAQRILASPDLYGSRSGPPSRSIDFVTCHDGMTLNDLVTYAHKRNEANGEGGRDGTDDDRSWDSGFDGPTDDPAIERLRERQIRNFLALTLFSLGVPMLLMGDEVRRTQNGNNNAYCHDDETTWFDWSPRRAPRRPPCLHPEAHRRPAPDRVARERTARHQPRRRPRGRRRPLERGRARPARRLDGLPLARPDLPQRRRVAPSHLQRVVGCRSRSPSRSSRTTTRWRRVLDTSLDPPDDLIRYEEAPPVVGERYETGPRSIVLLAALRAGEHASEQAPRRGHAT